MSLSFKTNLQLIFMVFCAISLSGCGLMRNRMTKNSGIKKADFDLPVFLYPANSKPSSTLVFLFSGDGGWLDFDDQLSLAFAEKGFNTAGFNSRSYFWNKKTPHKTANDLTDLINKYLNDYNANNIILCGYSFGADVVPFIYNRLPLSLKNKVESLILLSPFASTDFVVHTTDLLNIGGDHRRFKVKQETQKIKIPIFCFYGEEEYSKPLAELQKKDFKVRFLPGDHHYEKNAVQIIVGVLTY